MTISTTQMQILTAAAQHEAQLAKAPERLPAGARNAVFRSMLKNGLLVEMPAPQQFAGLSWRQDEAAGWIALRITEAGSAVAQRAQGGPPAAFLHERQQVAAVASSPSDGLSMSPGGVRALQQVPLTAAPAFGSQPSL